MTHLVPYVRREDWPTDDALVAQLRTALVGYEVVPLVDVDASRLDEVIVAVVDGPSAEQLASLPNLELIQSTWAGVEAVLPAVPEGVVVARLVDPQMAESMAEAVLAWTLYLHRDMPRYARQQRVGEWRQQRLVRTRDRRVGIAGLGVLGTAAAHRLVDQGFEVSGWARSRKWIDRVTCFDGADGLHSMLERSDIVVNLLPHTDSTVGTFDAAAFATMPRGSSIINFGRGPTIDDDALLAALDSGHLDHAVLDVFDDEPLSPDHRFWWHDSVTVLPHISAPTTAETAALIVAANVGRFVTSRELPTDALVDRSRGY